MKRNFAMKIGVILVALTLVTSCFVGGTFAKYTTSGDAVSSARVAEFGVAVTGNGTMFAKTYESNTTGVTGVTVSAETEVVAPGTSGNLAAFTITGTPEVAVEVSYKVDALTLTGWANQANAYYCPIIITVGKTTLNGLDYDSIDGFKNAITAAIEVDKQPFPPGTNLADADDGVKDVAISWSWAFDSTGNAKQNDADDTYLGDQAAKNNASTIALTVSAIVTQID